MKYLIEVLFCSKTPLFLGQCCGTVDSAVAYGTNGPGFKTSHWQLLSNNYLLLFTICRKDVKRKRGLEWPFLKNVIWFNYV